MRTLKDLSDTYESDRTFGIFGLLIRFGTNK